MDCMASLSRQGALEGEATGQGEAPAEPSRGGHGPSNPISPAQRLAGTLALPPPSGLPFPPWPAGPDFGYPISHSNKGRL